MIWIQIWRQFEIRPLLYNLSCMCEGTHFTQTEMLKGGREAYKTAHLSSFDDYFYEWALVICWRRIVDFPCWKSSLKVIHLTWGELFGNHGMLYIISNLPKVATWRSKGFRIGPLIAEKSTTLLFTGTLGHTVHMHIQSRTQEFSALNS